jgi:hypothetical protein
MSEGRFAGKGSQTSPPGTPRTQFAFRPSAWASLGLLILAVALAIVLDKGDGFSPRVETIDALAGLAIGAFCVDRLLTFIPPWTASKRADLRTADIDTLRWGWGALLGAAFVGITGLGAVAALTASHDAIDPALDRVIAVLAIAGGVKGLARFKDALNPPTPTSAEDAPALAAAQPTPTSAERAPAPGDTMPTPTSAEKASAQGPTKPTPTSADEAPVPDDTEPPPEPWLYAIGVAALVVAGALAAILHGDQKGVELIGPDKLADGTIALVARFGTLFVAAVVVQQLVERSFASSITGPGKKLLTGSAAVILGVGAARLMDLYLLHNIGFFATPQGTGNLNAGLAASTSIERFADVMLTGLVIAAGTAPLHDLASALKRASGS